MALRRTDPDSVKPINIALIPVGTTFTGKVEGITGVWWRITGQVVNLDDAEVGFTIAPQSGPVSHMCEYYRPVDIEYKIVGH